MHATAELGGSDHPLLNPNSKHYTMIDDVESIVRMEQMYTPEELMIWSKITAMKYRLRIGNKEYNGSLEKGIISDGKKIQTLEAYYAFLNKS